MEEPRRRLSAATCLGPSSPATPLLSTRCLLLLLLLLLLPLRSADASAAAAGASDGGGSGGGGGLPAADACAELEGWAVRGGVEVGRGVQIAWRGPERGWGVTVRRHELAHGSSKPQQQQQQQQQQQLLLLRVPARLFISSHAYAGGEGDCGGSGGIDGVDVLRRTLAVVTGGGEGDVCAGGGATATTAGAADGEAQDTIAKAFRRLPPDEQLSILLVFSLLAHRVRAADAAGGDAHAPYLKCLPGLDYYRRLLPDFATAQHVVGCLPTDLRDRRRRVRGYLKAAKKVWRAASAAAAAAGHRHATEVTQDDVEWAYAVVHTRSILVGGGDDDDGAARAVLVPVADLLNENVVRPTAAWTVSARGGMAVAAAAAGGGGSEAEDVEVTIDYRSGTTPLDSVQRYGYASAGRGLLPLAVGLPVQLQGLVDGGGAAPKGFRLADHFGEAGAAACEAPYGGMHLNVSTGVPSALLANCVAAALLPGRPELPFFLLGALPEPVAVSVQIAVSQHLLRLLDVVRPAYDMQCADDDDDGEGADADAARALLAQVRAASSHMVSDVARARTHLLGRVQRHKELWGTFTELKHAVYHEV